MNNRLERTRPNRGRFTARWQQGILTPGDQRLITIVLLFQTLLRGVDYVRDLGLQGPEYQLITQTFGPQRVGYALIFFALLTYIGMLMRWHIAVFTGFGMLSIIYIAIGVPILIGLGLTDSIRVPGVFLVPALIYLLLAIRTGREPLAGGRIHYVERISAPGSDQ